MKKPIEYPIVVEHIECDFMNSFEKAILTNTEIGDLVSVRPAGDDYDNKTFLGVFLGAAPIGVIASYNVEKKALKIKGSHTNPAILIPELKKIVWGYESWWGKIESEEQLKKITDEDIGNIWYVKALEQLAQERGANNENP